VRPACPRPGRGGFPVPQPDSRPTTNVTRPDASQRERSRRVLVPHWWTHSRTTTSPGLCALPLRRWPPKWPNTRTAGPIFPYAMHMAGPREALQHMNSSARTPRCPLSSAATWPGCKHRLGDDFTPATGPRTLPRTIASGLGRKRCRLPQSPLYRRRGLREQPSLPKHVWLHVKKLSGHQFRSNVAGRGEIA